MPTSTRNISVLSPSPNQTIGIPLDTFDKLFCQSYGTALAELRHVREVFSPVLRAAGGTLPKRRRPRGRRTPEVLLEAFPLWLAVHVLGAKKASVLRWIGKDPRLPAEGRWLNYRLGVMGEALQADRDFCAELLTLALRLTEEGVTASYLLALSFPRSRPFAAKQ